MPRLDRHQLIALLLAFVLVSTVAAGVWYILIRARGPAVQSPASIEFEPGDESQFIANGTEARFDFRVRNNLFGQALTFRLEFNLTAIGSDFFRNVTGHLGDQIRISAGQTLIVDAGQTVVLSTYALAWTHAGSSWKSTSPDFVLESGSDRWFGLYIVAIFFVDNAEYDLTITLVVL